MTDFDPERHYYEIKVVDNSGPEQTVMDIIQADSPEQLGEKMAALATLGKAVHPRSIEVHRITRLDAPLTDEEQADLDSWIEELGSASDGSEADGASQDEVERAVQAVDLQEGDVLYDPESNPRFGDGRVEVVEMANDTAEGYVCRYKNGTPITVADENPGHPSDDPVVMGQYVEGSSKRYAFPLSRLKESAE